MDNQAHEMVTELRPGRDQATALIDIAEGYSKERSDRGSVIKESLVPKLNELVTAAIRLD